jgi:hypothetical protein
VTANDGNVSRPSNRPQPTTPDVPDAGNVSVSVSDGHNEDVNVTAETTSDGSVIVDVSINFVSNIPVTIYVLLDDIGDINHHRLVAIRDDGTLVGGNYDPTTNTFSFDTSETGIYTITYVENMNRFHVQVGSATIVDLAGNAETVVMDVVPVIIDDRTLVPVRFITEMLGGNIDWNDTTREVTIAIDGKTFTFGIGETTPDMDVPAQIIGGRTMVPLRFISEFFDATVSWDPVTASVEIIRTY